MAATKHSSQADGDTERVRSEEHTSELQSQSNIVCRLLLEKKNSFHDAEVTIFDYYSWVPTLSRYSHTSFCVFQHYLDVVNRRTMSSCFPSLRSELSSHAAPI